ncbi:universal stress protein [Streptomyces sp. NPDC059063]|uniref:universal stress protein n=1 Tax=Streptomyces sp. NPDC059063 TaxID=3346712 RepID=UPI003682B94D
MDLPEPIGAEVKDAAHPSERALAEHVVASAAERARRRDPEVMVTAEVLLGDTEVALLREARNASALVVGHRGRGPIAELLLGPPIVVDSALVVDDAVIGGWDRGHRRPGAVIATGYEQYVLGVTDYDPKNHAEFLDLINRRLTLTIRYESLCEGENYTTTLRPRT